MRWGYFHFDISIHDLSIILIALLHANSTPNKSIINEEKNRHISEVLTIMTMNWKSWCCYLNIWLVWLIIFLNFYLIIYYFYAETKNHANLIDRANITYTHRICCWPIYSEFPQCNQCNWYLRNRMSVTA